MHSLASVAQLSMGLLYLASSASAAAIYAPNELAARATTTAATSATTTFPPGFPWSVGPVTTLPASGSGVCTASLPIAYLPSYTSNLYDCGRHTYLSTVTSSYLVECGACELDYSISVPGGGCPMGPTYTVTTVTASPTTWWVVKCSATATSTATPTTSTTSVASKTTTKTSSTPTSTTSVSVCE